MTTPQLPPERPYGPHDQPAAKPTLRRSFLATIREIARVYFSSRAWVPFEVRLILGQCDRGQAELAHAAGEAEAIAGTSAELARLAAEAQRPESPGGRSITPDEAAALAPALTILPPLTRKHAETLAHMAT